MAKNDNTFSILLKDFNVGAAPLAHLDSLPWSEIEILRTGGEPRQRAHNRCDERGTGAEGRGDSHGRGRAQTARLA